MIHVILHGNLGNNLFQYAAGKHLAVRNKTGLRLITYRYVNKYDIFGQKAVTALRMFTMEPVTYAAMIHEAFARRLDLPWSFCKGTVFNEMDWRFNPEVLTLTDGAYLNGYFQSEKYFKNIEHIIRNDLRFKKDSLGKEGEIYKQQIAKRNSVGLHVRRGDYLTSPLHNVCTMKYYTRAITYMQDHVASPHFFIFSDDITWCRENISIPSCSFVTIPSAQNNPIRDLRLMSLCKHNIISNSTFSWWAAWLNNNNGKLVVTPNRWFTDEHMNNQAVQDTIPAEWIRIDF